LKCYSSNALATNYSQEEVEIDVSPGSSENVVTLPAKEIYVAAVFESNTGHGVTSIPSGNWTVNVNVTAAASSGSEIRRVDICNVTSGGTPDGTIATWTGAVDVATTGVKPITVTQGSPFSCDTDDRFYIQVHVYCNSHSGSSIGITPSSTIVDTITTGGTTVDFAATVAAVSATPTTSALNIARSLVAIAAAVTLTVGAALNVARPLSATVTADTTTDGATLSNSVSFAATIAAETSTDPAALDIARPLAATVAAITSTDPAALDIDRPLAATVAAETSTAAATLTTGFVPSDIPQAEADALIWLYNATAGNNWTSKSGWLEDPVVNNWHGITVAGGHVTRIELPNNNLNGSITAFDPTDFPSIERLYFYLNASLSGNVGSWAFPNSTIFLYLYTTALSGDISGWTLPSSLVSLRLQDTSLSGDLSSWSLPSGLGSLYLYSSSVSGDISSWTLPSSLTTLSLYNISVSGDLSSWTLPSSLLYLYLYNTSISGAPDASGAIGLQNYQIQNNVLSQTVIDGIVQEIYDNWAGYTYATPTLNIGGTNSSPSGIYQDGDPPTTGKEYIYEIENDPETTGNEVWSVTYTDSPAIYHLSATVAAVTVTDGAALDIGAGVNFSATVAAVTATDGAALDVLRSSYLNIDRPLPATVAAVTVTDGAALETGGAAVDFAATAAAITATDPAALDVVRPLAATVAAVTATADAELGGFGGFDGWAHRIPITIESDDIDATLSDWTMVFDQAFDSVLTQVDGPLDADGTRASLNGGGDIRFSSDEAGTVRLPCDIREWTTDNTPASATCEVAVKVPSVSSSVDTTIYMWWGKTGETQPAADADYGQYDAYDDDHEGVWPFRDWNDRTRNGCNADTTTAGDPTVGQAGGPIGEHAYFDGNDIRSTSAIITHGIGTDPFAFELLAKRVSDNGTWKAFCGSGSYEPSMYVNNGGGQWGFYWPASGSSASEAWPDITNYHHVIFHRDGVNGHFRKDGAFLYDSITDCDANCPDRVFHFGSGFADTGECGDIEISEFRLHTDDRSDAWWDANYANLFNTAGFLTWGSISDLEGGVEFSAAVAAVTSTDGAALDVDRPLAAIVAAVMVTDGATLDAGRTLAATTAAVTDTDPAALDIDRPLTATITAATSTADATLDISGLIEFSATVAAVTVTDPASLDIDRPLTATVAAVTSTAAATLDLGGATVDFAATVAAVTATDGATLDAGRTLAATVAAVTRTTGAGGGGGWEIGAYIYDSGQGSKLNIDRPLAATITAVTSTAAAALDISGAIDFAATIAAVTATDGATLDAGRTLAATVAAVTTTDGAALDAGRELAATVAAVTSTADAGLTPNPTFAATVATVVVTDGASLDVDRPLAATVAAVTYTDPATLSISGAVDFVATIAAVTSTDGATLDSGRTLAATSAAVTTTDGATLNAGRELIATVAAVTSTAGAALIQNPTFVSTVAAVTSIGTEKLVDSLSSPPDETEFECDVDCHVKATFTVEQTKYFEICGRYTDPDHQGWRVVCTMTGQLRVTWNEGLGDNSLFFENLVFPADDDSQIDVFVEGATITVFAKGVWKTTQTLVYNESVALGAVGHDYATNDIELESYSYPASVALDVDRPLAATIAAVTVTDGATLTVAGTVDFIATVAAVTATDPATLVIARPLAASSSAATSTADATLNVGLTFAAVIAVETTTDGATLDAGRELAAAVTAVTSTADATLSISGAVDFAATVAAVTSTDPASLEVGRALAATVAAETATADATLDVGLTFSATVAAVTATDGATLGIAIGFSATVAAVTATDPAMLEVARPLPAVVAAVTSTADAYLAVQGEILFSATVAAVTETSAPSLTIARPLSASVSTVTATQDASLLISRPLSSNIVVESVTAGALMLVDREFAAVVAAVTSTSSAQMVLGILPEIVDPYVESLTTRRSFTSLTTRRSVENT
jgi:hypothetical protein